MPILPIPEYRPDVSDYEGDHTGTILNVIPRGDGYGPFPDFSASTAELVIGNDEFTKILLHMDGADASTTFTDANNGGSAHTWTANGDAQVDTAQSKFGGASGLFDGTGDYVTTPDHADFTLGSGDFTIDCWFRVNAAGGATLHLAGQMDAAATATTISFYLKRDTTNVMIGAVNVGGTTFGVVGTTQFTNAVNTGWHHLAFVRTGNTLKLFIDGVQEGGDVAVAGAVNNSTNAVAVGRAGELAASPWNGWVDEFRLSVGIARWTSKFVPPAAAYGISQACRGFFYARKADGSVLVFAATSTKLYTLDNTSFAWADVSKAGGTYTAVPAGDQWQFAQFNNFVFAVQINTAVQVFDLTSSTEFADLGGSPPPARYIAVVGRFLVLSGLGPSTPYRIQWSGLNATTTWTPGINQSDFQDFPDGGIVRGVAGGEYGIVFQDASIRRLTYAPGSPTIFVIDRISEEKGLFSPLSIVRAGDRVFYISPDGFQVIAPGGYPQAIGKERVDRTFFADVDTGNLQLCIGASDPKGSRVYWAYKSTAGASGLFDRILCYDTALNRWSPIAMTGEYLATLARPGATLESLDSISGSLDALPFASLDDISTASLSQLSAVNSAHKLGFFTGSNLEATMVTAEKGGDGRRIFVRGFRPITDAATVYGSVSKRETAQAAASYSDETLINSIGMCPQRVSTRYARGRIRIPAGTSWTFALGVEPDVVTEGVR